MPVALCSDHSHYLATYTKKQVEDKDGHWALFLFLYYFTWISTFCLFDYWFWFSVIFTPAACCCLPRCSPAACCRTRRLITFRLFCRTMAPFPFLPRFTLPLPTPSRAFSAGFTAPVCIALLVDCCGAPAYVLLCRLTLPRSSTANLPPPCFSRVSAACVLSFLHTCLPFALRFCTFTTCCCAHRVTRTACGVYHRTPAFVTPLLRSRTLQTCSFSYTIAFAHHRCGFTLFIAAPFSCTLTVCTPNAAATPATTIPGFRFVRYCLYPVLPPRSFGFG